jgi:hypothetical protein
MVFTYGARMSSPLKKKTLFFIVFFFLLFSCFSLFYFCFEYFQMGATVDLPPSKDICRATHLRTF